jgi:hypothetical protein
MTTGFADAELARFNKEITRFGKLLLPQQLVDFHQKVVLQVLSGVVEKTPVDTGRAKGGWQVTINFIDASIPTGVKDKAGGATIAAGVAALANLTPFSVVYISNNVEYIIPLEEGHSTQAPNGMLALTLEEVRQQFVGVSP